MKRHIRGLEAVSYTHLDVYKRQRKQGAKLPPVQHKTLFYPFTVFNAEQIYGLPAKEKAAPAFTEQERNAFLEKFITDSGIAVEHHDAPAAYSQMCIRDSSSTPWAKRKTRRA